MSEQAQRASSKASRIARSAVRIALAVVVIVTIVLVGALANGWNKFRQANAPNTRSSLAMLLAGVEHLAADGFVGCPTVQQVLEQTKEPWRTDLLHETKGVDSWGTPFQVECVDDRVRVFSLGPDKKAGTTDDISSSRGHLNWPRQ